MAKKKKEVGSKGKTANERAKALWIGYVEWSGYSWHVVSNTEKGAQDALFKEYREQKGFNADCKTWEDFNDFYDPWIQEAKLDKVVWL